MNSSITGQLGLFLLLLIGSAGGQEVGQECFANFKSGREDFVLDADDSVKEGATFISSPKLNRQKDCLISCCKEPRCNVAFMEKGDAEGLVKSCFLFDCLYKKKYVCQFVRKTGYVNFIMDSVYEGYLAEDVSPGEPTGHRFIKFNNKVPLKTVDRVRRPANSHKNSKNPNISPPFGAQPVIRPGIL